MVKITVSGDFAPTPKLENLFLGKVSDSFFGHLNEYLLISDFNIVNLEAPIIEKKSPSDKYGPALSVTEKSIKLLQKGGFNVCTLANNHIMDHGVEGLKNTIKLLGENDIAFLGVGHSLSEAQKPLILQKNGITIGIINIAENEFSNTHGDYPGAAPLDLIDNLNQIKDLKTKVDHVMLIFHGGSELHDYPSPRIKKTFRFFIDNGVDIVLAHHTHRFNGFEVYKERPIFFGLGNFVFDLSSNDNYKWALGCLVYLEFQKNSIIFQVIPFLQNFENRYGITNLDDNQLALYNELLIDLDFCIQNDGELVKKYQDFYEKVKGQYHLYLQPYSSKYFNKLYLLKVIPSFLKNNKRKRLLYLNLFRCEAHRDIMLKLLSEENLK